MIIGHRGLSEDNIENTLSAVKDTNEKCDMIEVDIRQTADDELIVFHDSTLERATGEPVSIKDSQYEELLNYTIFGSKEKIPTLEEVVQTSSTPILAEIKNADDLEQISKICSRTVYQSFDPHILNKLRDYVSTSIGILCTDGSYNTQTELARHITPEEGVGFIKDLGGSFVSIPYPLISGDIVTHAHSNDIAVYIWDLNSMEQVTEMRELGVDGLILDSIEIV